MKVYQIRLKLYMLNEIPATQIQNQLTKLIDTGFANEERLLEFHEKNCYKDYCFDMPYPIEKDGVYKRNNIYTVTIRTIREELARYFSEICVNQFTHNIKALTAEIRILPKKVIGSLYSLTPAIVKTEDGYWRRSLNLEEYEQRLKGNLAKKYNRYYGEKVKEQELYTSIEFTNKVPISFEYKGIKLLGDKIKLQISDNEYAQNIAYMALGTGILEMNGRGAGFVTYRWV